jgi:hypothetical protein
MNQALYAHMNKKKKDRSLNEKKIIKLVQEPNKNHLCLRHVANIDDFPILSNQYLLHTLGASP